MTTDNLSPRARAKRDQIREAASRLFLQQGFGATSMDGVASEAGVSKQTLYAYYRSKEDLLTDVLRLRIQETLASGWPDSTQRPAPTSIDDLAHQLRTASRQLITALMQPDYLALVRVIIAESPRIPALGDLFRETVPARVLGSVGTLITQARDAGLVRVDDVETASRMLVGSLLTWVLIDGLLVTDRPPELPNDDSIDQIVDLFLRSITLPAAN